MVQKNDIGYFSIHMGIYPRTLFIVKGKDKRKVIQNNFTDRKGNDLVFSDDNTSDACVWEVIEKSNHKYGFLIWLYGDASVEAIAHESTHIAFETFRDIGGLADEDNQEPFAYLVGWVAKQIKNALNYKKHKNK
jgi:hypothetical protein